jgi:hypothetical protein
MHIFVNRNKQRKKIGLLYFSEKTAQSKQSPNKQKLSQSGHPASVQPRLLLGFVIDGGHLKSHRFVR